MPVKLLVGAGLVGRAAESHPVGVLHFRPAYETLVRLTIGYAPAAWIVLLVDHLQSRFHFHVARLVSLDVRRAGLQPRPRVSLNFMWCYAAAASFNNVS